MTSAEKSRSHKQQPASGGLAADCLCRFCASPLQTLVVDLGKQPLCESFLSADQLLEMEPFYPLQAYVCGNCYLMQVLSHVSGEEIFGGEYAYFSSYSDSWLKHCSNYVDQVTERLGLDERSQVVEIASNDGYLLQFFRDKGIPVQGIEPAPNVAEVAVAKGIPTRVEFFGKALAQRLRDEGIQPDLLLGNNVLAHVPDLNDFVAGLSVLLGPAGTLTMEFPHVLNLLRENQFDTIYQEHYCYFSLLTLCRVFEQHGLQIFDVDEVPTHGGSLRIYASHADASVGDASDSVSALLRRELDAGLDNLDTYTAFGEQVAETKRKLLEFLIEARRAGKRVVAYGAPGKGNTLLNYCGIRTDFIEFAVDRSEYKQGRFLPGTHIPIYSPDKIDQVRPDYVVILPWNIKAEIMQQLAHIRDWGGQFVIPIPELEVC